MIDPFSTVVDKVVRRRGARRDDGALARVAREAAK